MVKFNKAGVGNLGKECLFKLAKRESNDQVRSGKQKNSVEPIADLHAWQDLDLHTKNFKSYIFGVIADTESELIRNMSDNAIRQANSMNNQIAFQDIKSTEERNAEITIQIGNTLHCVAAEVHSRIKYDKEIVAKEDASNHVVLPLEYFVENGGVCRHQAVATIAVLQKLREDGYVQGRLRLALGNMGGGEFANHVWVEHIDNSGRTWIIDPTCMTVMNAVYGEYKHTPVQSI